MPYQNIRDAPPAAKALELCPVWKLSRVVEDLLAPQKPKGALPLLKEMLHIALGFFGLAQTLPEAESRFDASAHRIAIKYRAHALFSSALFALLFFIDGLAIESWMFFMKW